MLVEVSRFQFISFWKREIWWLCDLKSKLTLIVRERGGGGRLYKAEHAQSRIKHGRKLKREKRQTKACLRWLLTYGRLVSYLFSRTHFGTYLSMFISFCVAFLSLFLWGVWDLRWWLLLFLLIFLFYYIFPMTSVLYLTWLSSPLFLFLVHFLG